MYERPISDSDIERRRRKINRRISWISLAIVLVAGVAGVLFLGERVSAGARVLTLGAVVAWVGFRLFRLRQTDTRSAEREE